MVRIYRRSTVRRWRVDGTLRRLALSVPLHLERRMPDFMVFVSFFCGQTSTLDTGTEPCL
jgi:hypothetical protein